MNEPTIPDIVNELQRIRVLEAGHRQLTDQIAELTVGMHAVRDGIKAGNTRIGALEGELRDNSAVTTEIRDILSVAKVGLRVLGGVGTLVRWAGYIAAAGVSLFAMWQAIRNGGPKP